MTLWLPGRLFFLPNGFFSATVKNIILLIQSEFLNGSDIEESIQKGEILDLSKEISIKGISTEDEPSR